MYVAAYENNRHTNTVVMVHENNVHTRTGDRGEQKKMESILNHDIEKAKRDTYQSLKLEIKALQSTCG